MLMFPDAVGTGAGAADGDPADGDPAAWAGGDDAADGDFDPDADGCLLPCGEASSQMPSPASTTTTTANTAFCWPGDSSIAPRYFLRRTGRSQNGSGVCGAPAPPPPSRSAAPAGADRGASPPDSAGPLLPIQPLEGRIGPGCQRGRDGAADHDPPPEPPEPPEPL